MVDTRKDQNPPVFEDNLRRLLTAAVPKADKRFDECLAESVSQAVRAERQRLPIRRLAPLGWAAVAATVLVLIGAALTWHPWQARLETAGQVTNLYGFVELRDGMPPQKVTETENLLSGHWVETASGSGAEMRLWDGSNLVAPPRTLVQVRREKHGARVLLRRGSLSIEVARQPPGKSFTVETPAAQVQVLGTKLDVHVIQKPDSRTQTRVAVTSGRVELESAGQRVVLLSNMEGVAEEEVPPVTRSLTEEVNEMIRLIELNRRLAAESGVQAGMPAIVEFNADATATVWTAVPIRNDTKAPLRSYSLSGEQALPEVRAFTAQGASIPAAIRGAECRIDLSLEPLRPGHATMLIVKMIGVEGIFQAKGRGVFELGSPGTPTRVLTLVQFRLPESARLEEVSPEPIETRKELLKLLVTVRAHSKLFDVLGPSR